MENLSENQKQRIANINYALFSISVVGTIGGIIYANRTGGKFWRYVGWGFVGGFLYVPAQLVATPFVNKIIGESRNEPNTLETKEEDKPLVQILQEELDNKNNPK
jgi:hypothetical protein